MHLQHTARIPETNFLHIRVREPKSIFGKVKYFGRRNWYVSILLFERKILAGTE